MKRFWNDRARQNAAWYIDTTLDFDAPDVEKFFERGRTIVDMALSASPVEPETKQLAVEIGCGVGRSCLALADRYKRVIGLDISSEMIEQAKELSPSPAITYMESDGSSLTGVENNSADLVFSYNVFIHASRPRIVEENILDVGRALKPGGLFVFDWNNSPGSIKWALRKYVFQLLRRVGIKRHERELDHAAFIGSAISTRRITRAVKQAGMEVIEVRDPGRLSTFCYASRPIDSH